MKGPEPQTLPFRRSFGQSYKKKTPGCCKRKKKRTTLATLRSLTNVLKVKKEKGIREVKGLRKGEK